MNNHDEAVEAALKAFWSVTESPNETQIAWERRAVPAAISAFLSTHAAGDELVEREINHPLHNTSYPISVVLSDLAAQEGCDGDPYDQMQAASEYIRELFRAITTLKARVAEGEKLNQQLHDKMTCMCGSSVDHSALEGHAPVSMYTYSLDEAVARAEAAEAENVGLRGLLARTLDWMEALRASGDAGNWDWDSDDVYTEARAAINTPDTRQDGADNTDR